MSLGVPTGAPFFFLLSSEKRTPAGMRFFFQGVYSATKT
jgi:hypothetical protein